MSSPLITLLVLHAALTSIFVISENRRPQSTLAWILVFIFLPGLGLIVYFLFGRNLKAFSRQKHLLRQEFEEDAFPLLQPVLSVQDELIEALIKKNPDYRRLTRLIRHNSDSSLTGNNRVQILQDASSFYGELQRDIEEARHSIHLQYFIWRSDDFTKGLGRQLVAKAGEGIEVRLLYDPIGSLTVDLAYLRQLRKGGVEVAPTSPLYQLHTIGYRNHRKITVIDGSIGYTGGMNIGQEHLDGARGFDSWRDTQLKVEGEGARMLQAVFAVDWYNAVAKSLFSRAYFPEQKNPPSEEGVPVQIVTSGPDSRWAAIRQLYFFMIVTAESHVYIQSPYFILDATVSEALKSAALSGIDVKIMLNARAVNDIIPSWAANTYISEVVDAGVQVFLYEPGYLHAKTISVDSRVCSIGSTNIDIRSFSINYELNAVLYDASLTKLLEQDFLTDLQYCREFSLEEYEASSRLSRFRDSATRLLSPLL